MVDPIPDEDPKAAYAAFLIWREEMEKEKQKYTAAAEEAGKEAMKKLEAGYTTAEKKADEAVDGGVTILQKLKKAKWTAAALSGAGLVIAFLLTR